MSLLAATVAAPSASAHHSPVMFDQAKAVTLTGTVRLCQWTIPHCYIQLVRPASFGSGALCRAHPLDRPRPDREHDHHRVPKTLTGPWTRTMVYARAEGLDRLIHEAFTNDRSEVENGVFTIEPPSDAVE